MTRKQNRLVALSMFFVFVYALVWLLLIAWASVQDEAAGEVLMVLCDGCDVNMIKNMAAGKGFRMNCLQETKSLIEKNFIFRIEKI